MKISASFSQRLRKVNSIDLNKQEALDADPKAIQQISLTRNLDHVGNERMLFVLGEVKENNLDFWQGTVKYSYFKTIVSVINSCYKEKHFTCAGTPWFASDIPNDNW